MSKDITEYIDDYCRDKYGHTNWAYLDTTGIGNIKEIEKNPDIEGGIIFYHEETRQDYIDDEQEDVDCDFKHEFDSPHKIDL
jgi:hypothetical protein